MLYQEPNNPDAITDINPYVSTLVNGSFTNLLTEVRNNNDTWRDAAFLIDQYLTDKGFELLNIVIGDQKDRLDPIQRDQIILICAALQHTPAEKAKRISRFAKLEQDIDWDAVSERATVLAKALHRLAVVGTLSFGNRLWEEYRIIARKIKISEPATADQVSLYVASAHHSLATLMRTLEHALFLKLTDRPTVVLTRKGVKSVFPKPELYDQVIDAAIECLNYVGIFIPVVQKTISEQRNPYMLFQFTQDLDILFSLIKKKGGTLTEKQVRDGVAQYARTQDLKERTINWMHIYLTNEYIRTQLSRPFAQKILATLKADGLGHGRLISLLKDKVSKSSLRIKWEAAFIINEILRSSSDLKIADIPLTTVRGGIVYSDNKDEIIDVAATTDLLREKRLLPKDKELSNKDRLQLKELAGIMQLTHSFVKEG